MLLVCVSDESGVLDVLKWRFKTSRYIILLLLTLTSVKCFKCGQLGHASLNCRELRSPPMVSHFLLRGVGKSPQKGQKGGILERDLRGLARAKRVKCLPVLDEDGSWWYTECAAEEESADAPQDGAEDENSGVLVLNCVLPQLDSLVVGAVLMHLRVQMKRTFILMHFGCK